MTLVKERPTGAAKRAARAGVPAGAFSAGQLVSALPGALHKLDPRHQLRNPVMFVVWVGSLLVTVLAVVRPGVFAIGVATWLWFEDTPAGGLTAVISLVAAPIAAQPVAAETPT